MHQKLFHNAPNMPIDHLNHYKNNLEYDPFEKQIKKKHNSDKKQSKSKKKLDLKLK